eukprot:327414_1
MLRSKCLKSTPNHIIEKEQEIETDMHLDGLSASHECVLTNKHIGLSNSYHKKQISIDFPKALNGKRGIYTLWVCYRMADCGKAMTMAHQVQTLVHLNVD